MTDAGSAKSRIAVLCGSGRLASLLLRGEKGGWQAACWVFLAVLFALAAPARADTSPELVGADEQYREALAHYDRGKGFFGNNDFVAAAVEFAQAQELFSILAKTSQGDRQIKARQWDRTALSAQATSYARADMPVEAYDAFVQLRSNHSDSMTEAQQRDVDEALQKISGRLGQLLVRGIPAKAEVRINGVLTSHSALQHPLRVAAGQHQVEVRADPYKPFASLVLVAPGQTALLRVSLQRSETQARVRVESTIAPATLELDGRLLGRLPLETVLRPGKHSYVVRSDGYLDDRGEISAEPGERLVLRVRLIPSRTPLGLRIEPGFIVGGPLRGDTPFNNSVDQGEPYSEGTPFQQGGALRLFYTLDRMRSIHFGTAFEFHHRPLNKGEFGLLADWCPGATESRAGLAWCPVTVGALLPVVPGETGKFTGGESALRLGTKGEAHLGLLYFHLSAGLGTESYKRSALESLTVGTWFVGIGLGVDL